MRRFIKRTKREFRRIYIELRRSFLALPYSKRMALAGGAGAAVIVIILLIVIPGGDKAKVEAAATDPDEQSIYLSDGVKIDDDIALALPSPTPTPVPTVPPTPTPTPDPTLERGMEGEEVQKLQERLMKLGFLDLDESTQLFGSVTESAVELFQRQVEINTGEPFAQDGIAGPQTLEMIYSSDAPKYVVKEGMQGDDITAMQKQLVDMGYMKKTTGYYGTETITAIKEFQSRNDLSVDGLAGTQTFELLYSPNAKESATKAKEARTKATISKMIEVAKSKLGCKYIRGNTGPNSFDCSGLVYYCLREGGSNRRRLNAAGYSQVSDWEKISSINSLKKGDLIFFYDDGFTKVGHVGIVINSSEMVDASSGNGKVVRREYKTTYWKKHFVCGRRPW